MVAAVVEAAVDGRTADEWRLILCSGIEGKDDDADDGAPPLLCSASPHDLILLMLLIILLGIRGRRRSLEGIRGKRAPQR